MVKKIILGTLAGLALIVVVFVIVVAMQPSEFSVSRAATVDAPPSVVFAQVNDFHKWESWSPWAKLDPNSTATFTGPDFGEGAMFAWAGNDDVGEGDMTITKSVPPELILIDLHFIKPFEGTSITEFKFAPVEGPEEQTRVTWTMSGHNDFMGRAVCLFMNMDKMVGGDFEKGLAAIKAQAEQAHAAESSAEPVADEVTNKE